MAVTKRLRYEVLKRDNHTCRYCGGTAPDVVLTIDHVVPKALGGKDEPTNLVTACRDCNYGKSSMPADAALVDDVKQDALRWSIAMRVAADMMAQERLDLHDHYLDFKEIWESKTYTNWRGETTILNGELPPNWMTKLESYERAGMAIETIEEAARVVNRLTFQPRDCFAYVLGVLNKMLDKQQTIAADIIDAAAELEEAQD